MVGERLASLHLQSTLVYDYLHFSLNENILGCLFGDSNTRGVIHVLFTIQGMIVKGVPVTSMTGQY